MVKIRAYIKLYEKGRKTPFYSGYRPLFNFIEEMKTSGRIDLIDKELFFPGEEGEVEILFLNDGQLRSFILGNDFENNQEPQFTVTKNTWFAARNVNSEGFALMGCTVSPGFHFEDFELADENLFLEFPELEKEIASLIRN